MCEEGENYCEGECIPDRDKDCVSDKQVNFTKKDEIIMNAYIVKLIKLQYTIFQKYVFYLEIVNSRHLWELVTCPILAVVLGSTYGWL